MSSPRWPRPPAGPLLLLACAALLLRLVITGEAGLLVRQEFVPFLVVAALVLAGLAVATLTARHRFAENGDGHGHGHGHGSRVPRSGWALLALLVAACLLRPGAVDSLTVSSQSAAPPPLPSSGRAFQALPPGNPLGVPLDVYSERSLLGGGDTLSGRTVLLMGFVSSDRDASGWVLARLRIRCCLADVRPIVVRALGAPAPPAGAWVEVRGAYVPASADGLAQVRVEDVARVATPSRPYLS